jgi:hypothetical protein
MKEEDIAKLTFSAIVKAIDDLRGQNSDYEGVEFPSAVQINGNRYIFVKESSIPIVVRGSNQ